MKKISLPWLGVAALAILLVVVNLLALTMWKNSQDKETLAETEISDATEVVLATEVVETIETEIIEPEDNKIRLMMLGDNLMHMGIVNSGRAHDGSYNYSFMFEHLAPYLAFADIKLINQETILGGNHLGFSGFPYFNSPTEVGDAIAEAGFNVVLHASNHSADQGIQGIQNCINFWKNHPAVLVTGIYENAEQENQDIALMTMDDVTFAILNYTYGPNMGTLDSDIQGHLGMLCNWNESSGRIDFTTLHPDVITDIQTAEQLADVVIVCPHWGTEYVTVPSRYQEKFATQMTEAGADLIIGTHPHVVQPVEWVESENGNRALCYYSLGNYVSTQKNAQSMLEAMAWVTFVKEENGVVILEEETGAIPMVCHYTANPIRLEQVYFLEEYTQEQAATHGIYSYGGVTLTLSELQEWAQEILGEWILHGKDVLVERKGMNVR